MKNRALFLDRDGVINLDSGYVYKIDDFQFVASIFDLVTAATRLNYYVIVITNQAGIGRGYYTESEFHELTDWVTATFKRYGGNITHTYFCPCHPHAIIPKYKKYTYCRKPNPGMILRAASDYSINLTESLLVGDKASDIIAGESAGVGINILYGSDGNNGGRTTSRLQDVLELLERGTMTELRKNLDSLNVTGLTY